MDAFSYEQYLIMLQDIDGSGSVTSGPVEILLQTPELFIKLGGLIIIACLVRPHYCDQRDNNQRH